MTSRLLTPGEKALAATMFGGAIDYDAVRVNHRKWWWFQPRKVTMAPDGHLWFHPQAEHYCGDFCATPEMALQGHFIHEMTHVWQAQTHGRWYLPLRRHPFCSYDYDLVPGKAFDAYGLEQQAEIVRHAFLLRRGYHIKDKPGLDQYEAILPFPRQDKS